MITILSTPATRAIAASAVTAAALLYVRPRTFFDSLGRPRVARWVVSRPDQLEESTPVPWWLFVAAVGVSVDLFV